MDEPSGPPPVSLDEPGHSDPERRGHSLLTFDNEDDLSQPLGDLDPEPTTERHTASGGEPIAFELSDSGPALELDLTRKGASSSAPADSPPRSSSPPPSAPSSAKAPPTPAPRRGPPPVPATPGPTRRPPPIPQKSPLPPPPPSAATSGEYEFEDLPEPIDFDLPAPKGGSAFDLPMPDDAELPVPADLDLPAPSELPAPKGGSEVAPRFPGDVAPKYGSELEPRMPDVAPKYGSEVEPRASSSAMELTDDDLEAAESTSSAGRSSRSGSVRMQASESGEPDFRAADSVRSPSPRDEKGGRGLLVAGLVGMAAVAGGAGLYAAGLLPLLNEPAAVERTTLTVPQPSGPARDRSAQVLAALATDTPEGYLRAVELAQADGDAVGQAEAALAFHLRYGPDPVLAGQAESLLEPHQQVDAPYVRRVAGLFSLANGDLDGAAKALAAEDLRSQVYRGWLGLRQRDAAAALKESKGVLAQAPSELGALHTRHLAEVNLRHEGALVALERSAKAHPEHLGLQMLLAESLFGRDRLAEAETQAEALAASKASKAYQADVVALRGRIAAKQGDRATALRRFDEALQLAANDAVKLERLRVLLEGREFADVRAGIDILLHDRPEFVDAMLLQAELAIATGDGDQALQILQQAEALAQGDARVPLLMGEVHAMRMAVDDAQEAFARARERDPSLVRATLAEANMLAKADRLDAALEVLKTEGERLAETPDAAATLLHAQAVLLLENDRAADARQALDQALTVAPDHVDALLLRGELLLATGDIEAARTDLEHVYTRTGGYPGLAAPLGRIYLRSGHVEGLRKLLGEQLDQDSPIDLLLLGARLRLKEGKLAEARGLVDQVVAEAPGSSEARLVRAQILLSEGDPQGAYVEIQQARPRNPDAEFELWTGHILESLGRPSDALPAYRRAVALEPTMVEAHYRLGRLLALRGSGKEAITELQQVVQATDTYPEAWLSLGLAYRDLGERERALEAFSKATELAPTLADAWYWQGRLQSEQNNHGSAIKALRKAIESSSADKSWLPMAYRLLGRSHFESGNKVEARATLQQFLKIAAPNDPGRAEAQRQLQGL